MPRKRRIFKLRRATPAVIDAHLIRALLIGPSCAGRLAINREVLAEAWMVAGDVLTRAYAAHHEGRMPWGWWEFEATAKQRAAGRFVPRMRIDVRTAEERGQGVPPTKHWPEPADLDRLAEDFAP
jgi:hypothetical protein